MKVEAGSPKEEPYHKPKIFTVNIPSGLCKRGMWPFSMVIEERKMLEIIGLLVVILRVTTSQYRRHKDLW